MNNIFFFRQQLVSTLRRSHTRTWSSRCGIWEDRRVSGRWCCDSASGTRTQPPVDLLRVENWGLRVFLTADLHFSFHLNKQNYFIFGWDHAHITAVRSSCVLSSPSFIFIIFSQSFHLPSVWDLCLHLYFWMFALSLHLSLALWWSPFLSSYLSQSPVYQHFYLIFCFTGPTGAVITQTQTQSSMSLTAVTVTGWASQSLNWLLCWR